MPTSSSTWGAVSRRRSAMARSSATISSRVLRTLASEWAALADTGMVSLCTPAANAASAPRRFGTSAITVRPGRVQAWRTTSAASAICGSSRAGTKDATSISRTPAAYSASIQRSLSAVGMVALTDCRPSRGPTSLMRTAEDEGTGGMAGFLGRPERRAEYYNFDSCSRMWDVRQTAKTYLILVQISAKTAAITHDLCEKSKGQAGLSSFNLQNRCNTVAPWLHAAKSLVHPIQFLWSAP